MNKNKAVRVPAGSKGSALLKLLLALIIFGGVLTAAWVFFLPTILASALHKHTGFGVKVTELRLNPFTAKVDLAGFVITNPEGFPRPEFIEVRSFSAKAKLQTLFSSRPEFDYATIDVAYVAFVRDPDGVLNTQLFNERMHPRPVKADENKDGEKAEAKDLKDARDAVATTGHPVEKPKVDKKSSAKNAKGTKANGKDTPAKEDESKSAEEQPMQFFIKRLELHLDKVIVADYTLSPPAARDYDCKLNYVFNDVSDPKQLLAPFALKSLELVGTALRGLIPGDIGKTMDAATKTAEPSLNKESETPGENPLKTVVEKLEESQKP